MLQLFLKDGFIGSGLQPQLFSFQNGDSSLSLFIIGGTFSLIKSISSSVLYIL